MKKEFAQLAHSADINQRYMGWYVSRKLNGWGCIWDGGVTRGMPAEEVPWYYKGGDGRLSYPVVSTGLWTIGRDNKPKVIFAPDWFLNSLPVLMPIQGELWCNDDLGKVKSICGQGIKGLNDDRWREIKFQAYNVKPYVLWKDIRKFVRPHSTQFWVNLSWKYRHDTMLSVLENHIFNNVGEVVSQTKITFKDQLRLFAKTALNLGWEGAMIINPFSNYEDWRSRNLLKVKPKFDIEAMVLYAEHGKGKHEGRMGSLVCRVTWDEKVTSFIGGKEKMIGKTVDFGVGGFTDTQRGWDYVQEHYQQGKDIPITFLSISRDGVPCSANIKE